MPDRKGQSPGRESLGKIETSDDGLHDGLPLGHIDLDRVQLGQVEQQAALS
jgi:hypothetical protein